MNAPAGRADTALPIAGILFAVAVAGATGATAQGCGQNRCEPPPTTADHVRLVALNSLLGGVSAGVVRIGGGEAIVPALVDGFLRGAAGGAITYAGKRVAADQFDGAGLIGRQIAAIGASTTANAADGVAPFDRWLFPLGPLPVRLLIDRQSGRPAVRPLVDLVTAAAVLYGVVAPRYSVDWGASFSGGVAIFREDEGPLPRLTLPVTSPGTGINDPAVDPIPAGVSVGGAVFVSNRVTDDRVIAHERVHSVQFDFLVTTLGDRVDTWVMANMPSVDRWLKINFAPLVLGTFNQTFLALSDHDRLPWEREAALLSGRR